MVRVAAEELEKAVALLDLAEERHEEHLEKGAATMERLRKLRGKDGVVRAASWTRGWQATLDELDAEEQRLQGEAQLRQDEVAVAESVMAGRQARLEEARLEYIAWFEYKKAMLEAKMRELELESDGSRPTSPTTTRTRCSRWTSSCRAASSPSTPMHLRVNRRKKVGMFGGSYL